MNPLPSTSNARQSTLSRTSSRARKTRETNISLTLNLDGSGTSQINTGIGFLDHMLTSLAVHARLDLTLHCEGDLKVDDHHTAEDCAITLGEAIDEALDDRGGIERFGYAYAPLDESLARCVIDLVRRPSAIIILGLTRERLGELSCENIPHFFVSLANSARFTLHLDVLRGENDHHRAESAFKAFALALRAAVTPTSQPGQRSTKGVL